MALLPALAILGAGFQTAGKVSSLREQSKLNSLHIDALNQQASQESDLFNIVLPNLVKQQKARRGAMATQIAKGGVDVGSGSALATLSEQARIDQTNVNLALWQQAVTQNRIATDRMLTKRANKAIKKEQLFTILGGTTLGLEGFLTKGGSIGATKTLTKEQAAAAKDSRPFLEMMFKGFGAAT